jgi:hypothetical protein
MHIPRRKKPMITVWSLHDVFHLEYPPEKFRPNLLVGGGNASEGNDWPDVSNDSAGASDEVEEARLSLR